MLMYNPEDKTYSKFITIEEMAEVQEKIKQIEERLKIRRLIHRIILKAKVILISIRSVS